MENPHSVKLRPSRLPRALQWGMLAVFAALLVVSGAWAVTDHWRRATFALGVGLLWLMVMRPLCDDAVIGWFSVRSRQFDMLFTGSLGGLMAFLALTVESLGS